jgi:hypothetical protein
MSNMSNIRIILGHDEDITSTGNFQASSAKLRVFVSISICDSIKNDVGGKLRKVTFGNLVKSMNAFSFCHESFE